MKKLTISFGLVFCIIIFLWGRVSVTQAAPPTVNLVAPSGTTATGTTLNGTFNPNSISTTAYFRYWEFDPGNCIDAGGWRAPTASGTIFADASLHAFSQAITGLVPNKTYYYCVIANSSGGTTYHSTTTSTFTTSNGQTNPCDIPPNTTSGYTVTAGANCSFPTQPVGANVSLGTVAGMDGGSLTLGSGASLLLLANQTIVFQSITKTGAAINKAPGGVMRKGYIYVKDADNDNFYAANSTTYSSSAADGVLTGQGYKRRYLITGSTYITQAVDCDDTNAAKNIPSTCAPAGTTANGVTNITATTATLNGLANPNGDAGTRGYFKYGTTNTGDCSTLHSTGGASTSASLITGTSAQPFSVGLTGLTTSTTYYWCAIVFNNLGTTYSTIGSFVPVNPPPSITAQSATSVTNNSATLQSTVNPNNVTTSITYRYSTSNVACSSLGSTLTGPSGLTGSANISPNATALSGLTGNTLYYYCATANSIGGTTNGVSNGDANSNFRTLPGAPTSVSGGSATQTSISVTWSNPAGGAVSYDLWRCTGAGCSSFAQITTGVTSPRSDTGLTCGTTYRYRIRANNASGSTDSASSADVSTTSCQPTPILIGASAGTTNQFAHMVIPSDGRPVITYNNSSTGWRVVKCADTNCSSISNDTAVSGVNGTGGIAMAIMSNTFPILVFDGNAGLVAYKCSNQSCTAGTSTTLVADSLAGQWPSVVVPSDNNPIIAYNHGSGGQERVFKCSNSTCTAGTQTTVFSTSAAGANSKITLSSDGLPFLIYGRDNTGLVYTKCGNAGCTSGNTNGTIESYGASSFPIYTYMARGSDNLPFMAYNFSSSGHAYSYYLRYAKCTNAACTTFSQGTIAAPSDLGYHLSAAMGTDGFPVVAYGGSGGLKVTKCGNNACSSGNITTVANSYSSSTPGAFIPAVAVNSSNIPFVAFLNGSTPNGFKVIKCNNSTCN